MDSGSKNRSLISGVSARFSSLCKRSSVAVVSGDDNPKPPTDRSVPPAAAEEDHPHPHPDAAALVYKLFGAVSSLKSIYIQLQQAHIPYQPDKIRAADALFVSELNSMHELHHLLAETQAARKPASLEIKRQRELAESLQYKIQCKEAEINRLRLELKEKNAELEEQLFDAHRELTPSAFADVVRSASESIHDFAKPLIGLMKASHWDLDLAAAAIDASVVYDERSHKKYAFESYLSRVMLSSSDGGCLINLDLIDRVMSFRDPFDALLQDPDGEFGRFCRLKYVEVVHAKMEASFFGNVDQRAFVLRGGHPRTPFYKAFVKMARRVWALQELARSFIPKAEAFYAEKGELYSEGYMESVTKVAVMAGGEERLRVGLNVMPGFKIGCNIIRCRVYLCRSKSCR